MYQPLDQALRDKRPLYGLLRDLLAIGVMAAVVLVLFWKLVLLGQIPTNADSLLHMAPWKSGAHQPRSPHNLELLDSITHFYVFRLYTAESLRHGTIPLWNPYTNAGDLYLANNQSAVFDPFGVVFLIFPMPIAFGLVMMLQLFAAGLLMYLLLKALALSRPAALLGALAFAFNGFFLTSLENTVFVGSGLWTPLVFLLLHRLRQTGRSSYAVWCAFPIAFLFFGGMGQLALYILPAAWLYSLAGVTPTPAGPLDTRPRWRPVALLSLACVLGIGLAAVQLLPMAEGFSLSQRLHGAPWYVNTNSLRLRELLTLAFPAAFRHPAGYNFLGSGFQRTAYVGILPLLLAGIAVFSTRARAARFFTWLTGGILGLLLTLDIHPLHRLLSHLLPVFDIVDHTRALILVAFALAALAAYGLDAVLTAREPSALRAAPRRLGLLVAIGLGLLFAVTLLARFARRPLVALAMAYLGARFAAAPAYYRQRLDLLFQLFTPVHLGVMMPLLVAGAGLALVRLLVARRFPRAICLVLLVGGTAADLLAFGLRYNPFVKPALIYPPTAATTFLQQDSELFRVAPIAEDLPEAEDPMPPKTNMPYGLQEVGGYDSITLASYHQYVQLSQPHPYRDLDLLTHYDSPLLDLANMKYVLTDRQIHSPKFELVFKGGTKIYRNRAVLPRAFIAPAAEVLASDDLVRDALRSPRFDPRKTVLLQEEPVGAPAGGGRGEARVVVYRPEEVVIGATVSGGGGWLVLSDTFCPGWEVTVDRTPAKIYRADYTFRAVPLAAGSHLVRFVYRPLSFRLGKSISLATLLLMGLLFGYSRWSRHRPQPR